MVPVIKTIKGNRYHYLQRTRRKGTRVFTENKYIGPVQKGDLVRATNKQTRQSVEHEVKSVNADNLALVEPISGIPFKFEDAKWSFKLIKRGEPPKPLQYKVGDAFIDKRTGERWFIVKVYQDKYEILNDRGGGGWMNEKRLLEEHYPMTKM